MTRHERHKRQRRASWLVLTVSATAFALVSTLAALAGLLYLIGGCQQ